MGKEWYIQVDGKPEGPYSLEELRAHPRVTPDTLVQRKGTSEWTPAGKVKALKKLFQDEPKPSDEEEKKKEEALPSRVTPNGLVIDLRRDPPHLFFWIVLVLIFVLYGIIRLFVKS